MANIKSAKKRIKTSNKKRVRNTQKKRDAKSSVKSVIKQAVDEKKSVEEIKDLINKANKDIDKAGKSRSIHPNKAHRMKSRMMKRLNKAGGRGK